MAANCIAVAIKNDEPFSMPYQTNDGYWNPIYLENLIDPNYEQGREDVLVNEPHFHYKEIEFDPLWKGKHVIFNGYYQSWRYFEAYRYEILHLFNFPYQYKPVCSIHARYGDYLTIAGKHVLINEDYLTKAMALITEKTKICRFKVFSDDLPHFKETLGHLHNFEYSSNKGELEDLIEMSNCAHNIGSSSTFSFWGAWLNRNKEKIVITQKDWFQPGWMNMNTGDIIPEEWIKL